MQATTEGAIGIAVSFLCSISSKFDEIMLNILLLFFHEDQ